MARLKIGQITHSQVDAATLVVRAPKVEVDLTVGGLPLADIKPPSESGGLRAPPAATSASATATRNSGLELPCSKAGTADLLLNGDPLQLKDVKPLPSSD